MPGPAGRRRGRATARASAVGKLLARVGARPGPADCGGDMPQGRRAGKDREGPTRSRGIRRLSPIKRPAQRGVVAEFGIAERPPSREIRRTDLSQCVRASRNFSGSEQWGECARADGIPTQTLGEIHRGAEHPARYPSTGRPSPLLGSWRPSQACRGAGARRRPNGAPVWESSSRRESARPSRSGITARKRRQTRSPRQGACGDEVLKR